MQSICLELVFWGTDGDTIQKLRRLYRDYDGRMNDERRGGGRLLLELGGGTSSVGVGGGARQIEGKDWKDVRHLRWEREK